MMGNIDVCGAWRVLPFFVPSCQELFHGTLLPDRKLKTLQQMEPVRLGLVREFSNGGFGMPSTSIYIADRAWLPG